MLILSLLQRQAGLRVWASTQYALNIASKFFEINNISINNDKTVAISINQSVKVASLSICGWPILIVKKSEAHHYLGIFLFMEGLSKLSVSKAHSDVCFFVNVMLRKAITDKQFSYLVSAVLQPIVSYWTQFSYVSSGVCRKWDVMVRKGLKFKAGLSHNFLDTALHHPFLYGLKTFEQMQSEGKIAALVSFSNVFGVLGYLFDYRFLDLQVLDWAPLDPLQFPVKLHVSLVNNFLAGIVKIFLSNELSLANNLSNAFCIFDFVHSLKRFGVAFGDQLLDKKGHVLDWKTFCCWKKLDPQGPVPYWFLVTSKFLLVQGFSASSSAGFVQSVDMNILDSNVFSLVKDGLHNIWSSCFEVYTDESLRNAGSVDAACSTATYFLVLDESVGVVIGGLLSSTLAELQAVALVLELILHTNSQAAIDVCLSELSCAMPNFHNWCWLKRCHIFNLVKKKDFEVVWVKVKGHSGILGNVKTDLATEEAARSPFSLLAEVHEHYLVAENMAISGNVHYFAGSGVGVIPDDLVDCIWHPDSHMLTEFTGQKTLNLRSYLMKTVHRCLPVAVQKRLYNKGYSGVLCLLCGEVEFFDYAFTCPQNVVVHDEVLVKASAYWVLVADLCNLSSSAVLQTLSVCSLDEARGVFDDKKQAIGKVVNFIKFVADLHHVKAWLVRSEHRVQMEKTGLVVDGSVVSGLSRDVSSILLGKVVCSVVLAGLSG
ncbi:hypothetical protein G9A89_009659 [Geosiphon pyriformis]|nr:hypothetical protein G9A89_009659 [Geosiphon pyriformis]